jgi:arylsulfatase A-like enzyme
MGGPRQLVALLWIAMLAPALLGWQACSRTPERPNIVLIIGDDVGWQDFGFMGAEVARTPNLDALAAQGVVFSHAFSTASSCRPSLQSLLTGYFPLQFSSKVAMLRKGETPIEPNQEILHFETVPRRLAERGYASFQGGKYWEGSYQMAGFTHGMTTRYGEEAEDAIRILRFAGSDGLVLGRATMQPLWDFIDEHAEGPFFVWFAPMLPHLPFDAPPRYRLLYEGKDLSPVTKAYYANLTRFDDRVGELLAHLEMRGLREKTLVIYISDNGWNREGDPGAMQPRERGKTRGKLTAGELGHRTPLVFSWPGVLPEGKRHEDLVSAVDLFSTILDFAGAQQVPGRPGRSLYPLLTGAGDFDRESVIGSVTELLNQESSRVEGSFLGPEEPEAYFLRDRTWRYVWYRRSGREELYRIREDPFETRNVVDRYPHEVRRFRREVTRWIEEMKRPFEEEPAD